MKSVDAKSVASAAKFWIMGARTFSHRCIPKTPQIIIRVLAKTGVLGKQPGRIRPGRFRGDFWPGLAEELPWAVQIGVPA